VLSGLLVEQARMVLAAHRRAGLVLSGRIDIGHWSTLIVRKP
jgi:ribosomal protein L11 methyltransferase